MAGRHARQTFLGDHSDAILDATRMAVVGLGGGGSHVVQQLAHLGVGGFVLIDPDSVDETNLNRLVGATSLDAKRGTPKIDVAARLIKSLHVRARVTRVRRNGKSARHSLGIVT